MSLSKNIKTITERYDKMKSYPLAEALDMVLEFKFTKFDETVDLAINLDVDPRHAEENIRVTTPLPHGTGKSVTVLVLAQGPKEKEGQEAGADFVGNKDYLTKIKNGWTDVDKIIATPDMMGELGKLGRILGPKGLMPNPKSGTVTDDIEGAIKAVKAGRVEYKVDKTANIGVGIGKRSFTEDQIVENAKAVIEAIGKARPSSVKGTYIKNVSLSASMSPGIKVASTEYNQF